MYTVLRLTWKHRCIMAMWEQGKTFSIADLCTGNSPDITRRTNGHPKEGEHMGTLNVGLHKYVQNSGNKSTVILCNREVDLVMFCAGENSPRVAKCRIRKVKVSPLYIAHLLRPQQTYFSWTYVITSTINARCKGIRQYKSFHINAQDHCLIIANFRLGKELWHLQQPIVTSSAERKQSETRRPCVRIVVYRHAWVHCVM